MTVDYTEAETREAVRSSYRGVKLELSFGPEVIHLTYNTGEFGADYNAAVAYVQYLTRDVPEGFVVPFLGSSTVDHYMYDAGYTEVE
jgi:hypothetical protein